MLGFKVDEYRKPLLESATVVVGGGEDSVNLVAGGTSEADNHELCGQSYDDWSNSAQIEIHAASGFTVTNF